jgi:hypothetical protein
MISEKKTPRLLGVFFLIVILTSLSSGLLLQSAVGQGSISDILVSISEHKTIFRFSILIEMFTAFGIIILASLLYIVLHKQNKILALIAFGWWLAEGITLLISKMGTLALIPLSRKFIEEGASESSIFQALGDFLYYGFDRQGYSLHMWFYCLGGILWYYLFFKSKYIPRVISLFGIIAVSLSLGGLGFLLFGFNVPIFISIPILPFELAIGFWLVIKGIKPISPKFS